MSVPLQTVPDDQDSGTDSLENESVSQAKHEAAEIIARARRQAEAIEAEARSSDSAAPSPLAALGDNAEEIIGQVRKLIKKQRELQTERETMQNEIEALKSERDELVHRLTDAVERMEELAVLAEGAEARSPMPMQPQSAPPPPPPPAYQDPLPPPAPEPAPRPQPVTEPSAQDDTSLAARLKKAEKADPEDTSLAARLKRAEQEENVSDSQLEQATMPNEASPNDTPSDPFDDEAASGADGRSFYDRHSAKLPRLEGDGGHSVLSAMGGMRPEPDNKTRKGRRGRRK